MIVRVVINGLGHMGMPGLIAVQQIAELLRLRQIEVSITGLIDVDTSLRGSIEFFTKHLSPSPALLFRNLDDVQTRELGPYLRDKIAVRDSGESYIVYDASPNKFHFRNLTSCLTLPRVTYLAEKPMVTSHGELIQLYMMAGSGSSHPMLSDRIYCDLIETQSAVCLHLRDMVANGDLEIERLRFYRLNSSAILKAHDPQQRSGVQGGSLLDKSIHDISVTIALLAPNHPSSLSGTIDFARPLCFIPCISGVSFGLLNGYNGVWSEDPDKADWPADGASVFQISWKTGARTVPATYHSSWIGVGAFDNLCKTSQQRGLVGVVEFAKEYKGCPTWLHSATRDEGYRDEDARLLEVCGRLRGVPTKLLVNFLPRHEIQPWIWDSNSNQVIDIPRRVYGTNSLARVLELVVLAATGSPVNCIGYDAALLCHEKLIDAHRMLVARPIRADVETKIALSVMDRPVDVVS